MSSIAMAADSTHGRKHKAKPSRQTNKEIRKQRLTNSKANSKQVKKLKQVKQSENASEDSGSDRDSDLDLSKELLPIAGYIGSSEQLVGHMFCSISTKKLKAMLPEILKPISLDELKSLCTEQLEGMSKKRITRILDGDDPDEISSSGTEDNVDMHSFDVAFKDDDHQTSADTTKKCYADTTHYESVAAVESSCMADGVSATAAISGLSEPASTEYDATGYLSQSSEGAAVAHNKVFVSEDGSVSEIVKPFAAASVAYDLVEGTADSQELDYDEEPEVEQLSEVPGTPASLPSLVSEPDDTCTPIKFLKTYVVETDDAIPVEQSADGRDLVASPVAEVDSVPRQASPSPHLVHCEDDALASAENENNMNVESENNNVADRPVEAADTADVAAAVENSENVGELQLEDEQDKEAFVTDETQIAESSSIADVSYTTDTCETELAEDHAVLSSCSAMIIEVQDDEFSDEQMESEGKNERSRLEPPVLPESSKPRIEQHELQQLGTKSDDKSVTVEQRQKSQTATRIIRLNRFPQDLTGQNADTSESQSSGITSGRKRSQKPEYDSKHSSHDRTLPERTKLTAVAHSNNNESCRPKQSKLDSISRPSSSQATQKNLGPARRRSGEVLTVKVKSSPDSSSAVCSESVTDEYRKVRMSQQPVSSDQQSDVTPESHGSSESDSLSKTQLEILELEMRARAIKAMIRAQEAMEQLESVKKKRRSSDMTDFCEETGQPMAMPPQQHSLTRAPDDVVRPPSSSKLRSRGELRSLQSVIGRNIIKRAECVARRQRRMAETEGRLQQQRKQFAELKQHRRLSQDASSASRRTVRLQSDTRWHPMRYVVASQSSPRVVRLQSARFGMALPFFQRHRQRRFEVRRSVVPSHSSRGDRRQVLVASDRRFVRMSSTSRPY